MLRIEMSIDPDELEFVSGSVYWTCASVLQGLRALNLASADFDEEKGQVDATTVYAIERIIGIVTGEAGLRTVEVPRLMKLVSELGCDAHGWRRFKPGALHTATTNTIPFYLPQFYKSEENNRRWGWDFAEWSNVVVTTPVQRSHYQPKQSIDLGYCNLELDRVRMDQADLAAANGIGAFMYYYYQFFGKRALNRSIEKLRASDLDFPSCIIRINENWVRRQDRRSQDILTDQDYSQVPTKGFIDGVMRLLLDPRYLRVDSRVLIAAYHPVQTDNFPEVVTIQRERARAAGIDELKVLVMAVVEELDGLSRGFCEAGLDGMLQFPPHNLSWAARPVTGVGLDSRWHGNFMDYWATIEASLHAAPSLADGGHPGAMVGFDNTTRRQWKADAQYGSNPYTFHRWIAGLVCITAPREARDRLPLVNA